MTFRSCAQIKSIMDEVSQLAAFLKKVSALSLTHSSDGLECILKRRKIILPALLEMIMKGFQSSRKIEHMLSVQIGNFIWKLSSFPNNFHGS